jgi:large subunit ribosomal protein L23
VNQERLYNVLEGAHISEKATIIADLSNQFVFKVVRDATKGEIKEAVEKLYGVVVKRVTVLNVKGKVKRTARGQSRRPSWKKAYVRLEAGHDIDFAMTSD